LALEVQRTGRRFNSRSRRRQATTLGKFVKVCYRAVWCQRKNRELTADYGRVQEMWFVVNNTKDKLTAGSKPEKTAMSDKSPSLRRVMYWPL